MSFIAVTERLGNFINAREPMPVMRVIDIRPMRLTRGWADCPLCDRGIYDCNCEPDAYGHAVYARMRAEQGEG